MYLFLFKVFQQNSPMNSLIQVLLTSPPSLWESGLPFFHFSLDRRGQHNSLSLCVCVFQDIRWFCLHWACVYMYICSCVSQESSFCLWDPALLIFIFIFLLKGGIIASFYDLKLVFLLPSRPAWPAPSRRGCICVCIYKYIHILFVCARYNCFPWPPARTFLCGLPRSACLDNSGAHVGWNMAAVLGWIKLRHVCLNPDGSLIYPYI